MTDVALCGRALGTWRPRRARRGLFLASASAPSSSSKASWNWSGWSFSDFCPCNARRSSFNRCSRRRLRSLSAATSARSASRAACCPSNNTRKGGASDPGSTMPVLVSMTEYYHEIRHLVNKIRDRKPPLRHAAASGRRTRGRHTRRQSRPSNNASNCARESRITPSRTDGQAKRPCSRRFDASTRPVPSHHRTLIRSRRLGRNTTTTPEKGSRPSSCSTSAARALPLAKVHRTRRHHDPWRRTRNNHRRARSAAAISAIRAATESADIPVKAYRHAVSASIDTEPTEPGPGVASTSSAAKAGSDLDAATLGSTSALRAAVRAAGAAGSSSTSTGEDRGELAPPRWAARRSPD